MSKALSYLLDQKDLKKEPLELQQICKEIFSRGKGVRSQLVSLVADFLSIGKKDQLSLSRIIEYIHNSSLLHDDLIDGSKMRRSRRTAWLKFSPSQAVLAGDYMLSKVNIDLVHLGNPLLHEKTALAICQLVKGEFLQRESIPFQNKDLKKRNHISEFKTASLFKWCLQAPFIFKKRKEPELYRLLNQIGYSIGLLFQRSDDLMDFSVRNKDKKPYLSDIQQKYFNSFSCFLLEKAPLSKEKKLQKVKSLSDVFLLFSDFQKRVQDFDEINSRIIKRSQNDLKKLSPFLKRKEKDLIDYLQEWIYRVYWREKY